MTPVTGWYRLELGVLPRGLVVADARASAARLWDGPIVSVLEEVADRLPAEVHPEVVFLGGRTAYPLSRVLRGLGSPHHHAAGEPVHIGAQLGRYPVAGPALRDWELGPPRPVLVVLAGPTIDLDDWAVPEVTRHTLVYRLLGGERVSPPAFRELDPNADLGTLAEHLRDPVSSIRVGDESTLAIDWDRDDFRWQGGCLSCDRPQEPDLVVRLSHPEGVVPSASVARASGTGHTLPLAGHPPPDRPPATMLTPAEGVVMGMWAHGSRYYCQHCRQEHPPGQLRCRAPSAGPGLFPSLSAATAAPIYLASGTGGHWSLAPVPRGIVPLREGCVVVRREGEAPVYAFAGGRWEARYEDPGDFIRLDDGRFALRSR